MTLENFVRVVRRLTPDIVGTKPGMDLPTRGRWRDHDGSVQPEVVSGKKGDPLHDEARVLLIELGAPKQALDLAAHVEIKVATIMRRVGQASAELVINNVVCGSLNPEWKYTCERVLSKILRPGQKLTVEGIDKQGRRHRKTYEGTPKQ